MTSASPDRTRGEAPANRDRESGAASTDRKRVAVFFGGVSPEHEVSVISGLQALAALDQERWRPVPVYVDKGGVWWSGSGLGDSAVYSSALQPSDRVFQVALEPTSSRRLRLRRKVRSGFLAAFRPPESVDVDIVLPVMHGGTGENGSLQGLCETLGIAYAGSGPLAAALAMDKAAAKTWAKALELPQVSYHAFTEADWAGNEEKLLDDLEQLPGIPAVVKPASLGSSIGIMRATSRDELDAAIEEAFRYDNVVVVERAVADLRELNCSVLGRPGKARASVIEEPLGADEVLSFRDKYMSDSGGSKRSKGRPPSAGKAGPGGMASLDRKIPADIPEDLAARVTDIAVRAFEGFGCQGVVRIDFMLDGETGALYFNEINTLPGSLSFYLWAPSGVPFGELLDTLLELGLERHRKAAGRLQTYDVNLLSEKDLRRLKGAKG